MVTFYFAVELAANNDTAIVNVKVSVVLLFLTYA